MDLGYRSLRRTTNVSDGSNSEILARSRCFPLYPRKRTYVMRAGMSELCQFKRHRNALFNHLIGTAQQRLGNCKAQHLGRLEIDNHLDFRGPLDRQVGGFLALENLTGVNAD